MTERTEPALDTYASAATGWNLEDLSRVAAQQPYRSDGPKLPRSALDELVRGRRGPHHDALVAATLADNRGRPTSDGSYLVQLRQRARTAVRIDAQGTFGTTTFEAWLGGREALVVAGDPATADRVASADPTDPDRTVQFDLLGLLALPIAIAAWVGLGPAWSFAIEPGRIPGPLFTARLADPTVASPDDADARCREMWAQPWIEWRLRIEPTGRQVAYLNAGNRGHFQVASALDSTDIMMQARPSALVWRNLLTLIGDAVTG